MSNPTLGDRATCAACARPIIYTGETWRHEGEAQPRHIAMPAAWLTLQPRPASTITATVALLRPSASGEELELLDRPREFSATDWGLIAREVNDWLRIEVIPYWDPELLRMDVEAVAAPNIPTIEALRAALYGLAVAWGLQWQ